MERDYDFSSRLHFADLDAPAEIGRKAGERAVRRLNARKAQTGPVTVIYDPRVARGIAGHLAGAINGASVARKTSFLRDMMGKKIAASAVTVTDDPLRVRGPASRPFDGEGVEGEALDMVKDGVLQHWFLSTSAARELGLTTNGRGARSGTSVSPSSTNLAIEPGDKTPEELIKSLASGFYVTEVFGQGVNMVTGEYSRGASGFWIENGELTYPGLGGDDRLEPEGHVPGHRSGQRRRPQFRDDRADAADRGHDACRQLNHDPGADDLALISEAAREAGRIALGFFKQSPEVWMKGGTSPVSEADYAVDRFLRETLTAARPDYGWLSEETADSAGRLAASRTFVVDPIDGTRAFLDGRSTWCVSIAVVEDGHPLAGVLDCPATGEIFSASAGKGACKDGRRLHVGRAARAGADRRPQADARRGAALSAARRSSARKLCSLAGLPHRHGGRGLARRDLHQAQRAGLGSGGRRSDSRGSRRTIAGAVRQAAGLCHRQSAPRRAGGRQRSRCSRQWSRRSPSMTVGTA